MDGERGVSRMGKKGYRLRLPAVELAEQGIGFRGIDPSYARSSAFSRHQHEAAFAFATRQ